MVGKALTFSEVKHFFSVRIFISQVKIFTQILHTYEKNILNNKSDNFYSVLNITFENYFKFRERFFL